MSNREDSSERENYFESLRLEEDNHIEELEKDLNYLKTELKNVKYENFKLKTMLNNISVILQKMEK